MNVRIEPARAEDLPSLESLLAANHLPLDGFRECRETTVVAHVGEQVAGCAALELFRDGALLRSVVVGEEFRKQGLGDRLVDRALVLARRANRPDVYLLTTTAERYFATRGFEAIDRAAVPASVQRSVEFASACPASAAVMHRRLVPLRVVFACVHNAGRSQMAAALLNRVTDPRVVRAVSAGTRPGASVHPEVVVAMRELGVDLTDARPQALDAALGSGGADWLITMGCGEECPYVPGAFRSDWPVQDPKGQPIERVREIRDEIAARVDALVAANGWRHE